MKIPTPNKSIKLGKYREWEGVPSHITKYLESGYIEVQFYGTLGQHGICYHEDVIKNNSKEISVWRFLFLRIKLFV